MNNKFLIVMDTHIKDSNIDLINNLFDQIIDICVKNDIHTILHGGDIFQSRVSQSSKVLECVSNILIKLNNNDIITYCIPANHDKTNLESENSFLDTFIFHPGFNLYTKELTNDFLSPNICFHFLPYFKENGSYLERLSNLKVSKTKKNILLTHIAISGVKNNDGSVVENNLKTELFNQFDKVYVAHYHDYSKLNDKIEYLGSLYQANFGENNRKGVHILHDNGDLEFIKLDFPEYNQFRFKCSQIKEIKDKLKEIDLDDKNRFIISGNEVEIDNFNRKIFEGFEIEVKYDKIYENKKIELKKYKTNDIIDSFELFCKDKKTDNNIKNKCLYYLNKVL